MKGLCVTCVVLSGQRKEAALHVWSHGAAALVLISILVYLLTLCRLPTVAARPVFLISGLIPFHFL
jgi:hypothetical protein